MKGEVKGFLEAVGFFTILPAPGTGGIPGPGALRWLPAVGLLIGLLWACFHSLGSIFIPRGVLWGLDVLFVVIITGGIHLDGLADTADGLLSYKSSEEALRIMHDSRIGTWGVLAIVSVLGLKGLCLKELAQKDLLVIMFLVPAYGRLAMIIGLSMLPYGRGEEGIAYKMIHTGSKSYWTLWSIVLSFLSLATGFPAFVFLNGAFALAVILCLAFYSSKVHCITGDMAGALGEISETSILLALALMT